MLRAGAVGEDKAVEAIEPVFRVATGPRAVLSPGAKRRELRMRGNECLHRVWVLAPRSEQQFVKCLRRRHRKEWGIDHSAAPLLPVRRRDAQSQAPHPDRRIRRIRIRSTEIEASEDRILTAGEHLSM